MARTPAGSWAGCSTFGVRSFFERARLQPDAVGQATRAINAALLDLGITRFRLESLVKEPGDNPDVDNYVLTLVDASDPGRTYSQSLRRS